MFENEKPITFEFKPFFNFMFFAKIPIMVYL